MDKILAQQILREAERRGQTTKQAPSLVESLFPEQRAAVDDPSPLISVDSGRRGGKTFVGAVWCYLIGMLHPRSWVPIVETTMTCMAARVMWSNLQYLNEDYGLGAVSNKIDKTVQLPNGTTLQIVGADQTRLADRLRGAPFSGVLFDETGSFRPSVLEYMMVEAIEPALMDHQGRVMMIGTPSVVSAGPFYRACNGEAGWSHHHWTCLQNPHIPHAADWLAKLRQRRGWTEDEPIYRREWMGEWVHDPSAVVYRFDAARNLRSEALPGPRTVVIGLDLGYEDSTAFCVVSSNRAGDVRVDSSYKRQHMIPSAIAVELDKLRAETGASKIIVDTGGLGKGYAEEFKQRYKLPVEAAKKTEKFAYIELLNGDLRSARLSFDPDSNKELIEEMSLLQWDDRDRQKIDDRYDDHLCDAMLYAWRYCRHARTGWELELPQRGTPEYYEQLEEEMWAEQLERPDGRPWWELGGR